MKKNSKIPEFLYMIYARKIKKNPKFYMLFARKIFFPNLGGRNCPLTPPPTPMGLLAYIINMLQRRIQAYQSVKPSIRLSYVTLENGCILFRVGLLFFLR